MEDQGHAQGAELEIRGDRPAVHSLAWPPVTDQMRRCWNDPQVATEHGAVGIAVLVAKAEIGYEVIERSRKGTGFDYWMGDDPSSLFQNKARLEISGIRSGDAREIRARLRQKIRQTDASDGDLPAYVVVVEFSTPLAEVRKK